MAQDTSRFRGLWLPALVAALLLAVGYGLGFASRGDSGAEELRAELGVSRIDVREAQDEAAAALQSMDAAESEIAAQESEIADLEAEVDDLQQELDSTEGGGGDQAEAEPIEPVEESRPVPDVVGDRLDVARAALESAGFRVAVLGGGLFGVIVESNWTVCEQQPGPGTTGAKRVRVVVDRFC